MTEHGIISPNIELFTSPVIYLEGLRKTTTNRSKNSGCRGHDSSQEYPMCWSEVLPLDPPFFINCARVFVREQFGRKWKKRILEYCPRICWKDRGKTTDSWIPCSRPPGLRANAVRKQQVLFTALWCTVQWPWPMSGTGWERERLQFYRGIPDMGYRCQLNDWPWFCGGTGFFQFLVTSNDTQSPNKYTHKDAKWDIFQWVRML
jgi:hypothetical protein